METALNEACAVVRTLHVWDWQFKGSSNIEGFRYEVETGLLTVTFSGGGRYQYHDVPLRMVVEWTVAESAGSWFHHNIRGRGEFGPSVKMPAVNS